MEGAGPSTVVQASSTALTFNNANVAADLDNLHRLALLSKLTLVQTFEEDTLAVAILDHNKSMQACTQDDFHWFKLKLKHSINKLRDAYKKKTKASRISLKQGDDTLTNDIQMRHLRHLQDNIIVLVAETVSMEQSASQSSTTLASTPARFPLGQIENPPQFGVNGFSPTPVNKPIIKSEQTYASPFGSAASGSQSFSSLAQAQPVPSPLHAAIKPEHRNDTGSATGLDLASIPSASNVRTCIPSPAVNVKPEEAGEPSDPATASSSTPPPPPKSTQNDRIQTLILKGTPEQLETEVKKSQDFLKELLKPLTAHAAEHKDASHWSKQIELLQNQKISTPTIIGVVGNTGAGKSSVINAMLEEDRLVPTNCMRACTAVVTEISMNTSTDESSKYRADIEFVRPEDWRKDLELSLSELLDSNGQVSRDCANPETEAGVAYAKIKAVYPNKTKDDLVQCTVEQLMREPGVQNVLGTTKEIAKGQPGMFYRALQGYVDSKEKATGDKGKKDKRDREVRTMEFWPLIKVVRIYTKADCLSTGAVIVDLPGVHDSNAARAAVAAGYMKECTGLFIVAPINRAVDDKAAKSLLGESFKRQLKFDGTYSRITFICSKTDDISLTEASDSLGLEEEMAESWKKVDEYEKEQTTLKKLVKELKESKGVYTELMNDADDAIEVWDKLKDSLDEGETVYAPEDESKKRKRSASSKKSRKRSKKTPTSGDEGDDFIDDAEEDDNEDEDEDDSESDSESVSEEKLALTAEDIDTKLATLKADKKKTRQERLDIERKVKEANQELKSVQKSQADIEAAMSAICIEGRNKYSRGAIQRDFADGIRELDQEAAQEEDPDQFDPEDEIRNYEEVAQSLPVFCVSSRAYQKMQGRLIRDNNVPGFRSAEETEIPQLQAHCKKLTEGSRASNCRSFLTTLCQILNSLGLWASNDGSGVNLTDAQLAAETRFLKLKLQHLESSLEKAVSDCLKDMNDTLSQQIFENYDELIDLAIAEANATVTKWHQPVNRADRALGGYYWATYKAIMRREGIFTNAQGPHDFNGDLIQPIIKHLATHWERCFSQRMPRVLTSFSKESKNLLSAFHREVELRSMQTGNGTAGLMLLKQQLVNYDAAFVTLAQQMTEVINGLQREANREFTPVISRNLEDSYTWCSNESGSGCFARMKCHMGNHVDQTRNTMFNDACNEVKGRLVNMCREVERTMADKADDIFLCMQRDYMEVISGTALPKGQVMPRWERTLRADVAKVIEAREAFAEEADDEATPDANAAVEEQLQNETEAQESAAPEQDASEAQDGAAPEDASPAAQEEDVASKNDASEAAGDGAESASRDDLHKVGSDPAEPVEPGSESESDFGAAGYVDDMDCSS